MDFTQLEPRGGFTRFIMCLAHEPIRALRAVLGGRGADSAVFKTEAGYRYIQSDNMRKINVFFDH